jgi:hypothetical protein
MYSAGIPTINVVKIRIITIFIIPKLYINDKYTIVVPKKKPYIIEIMNKLPINFPAFKTVLQLAHVILSGFNLKKNRIKDIG